MYKRQIDIWTHVNSELSNILMKTISSDDQGFNSVYMMLDSGARCLLYTSIAEIVALLQSPAKNVISALQSVGNTIHGVLKTLGERPEA